MPVTPATIGARFSGVLPWTGQPVISVQDGGRRRMGGLVGSEFARTTGAQSDDGSATGVTGTWLDLYLSEGLNESTWQSYLPTDTAPWYWYKSDCVVGSLEPHPRREGFNPGEIFDSSPRWGSISGFPDWWCFS